MEQQDESYGDQQQEHHDKQRHADRAAGVAAVPATIIPVRGVAVIRQASPIAMSLLTVHRGVDGNPGGSGWGRGGLQAVHDEQARQYASEQQQARQGR